MRKRILSITLVLALCLSLLPGTALAKAPAAGNTTLLDFSNVGGGEGQTPAQGDGYEWSGDAESGYRLVLHNFQMDVTGSTAKESIPAIKVPVDGPVEIVLTGENTITAPGRTAIAGWNEDNQFSPDAFPVTVYGGGTLTSTSTSGPFNASDYLLLQDVTIKATTTQSGIHSQYGDITLESVDFTMNSDGYSAACIWTSKGDVTINNSTLNLTTGDQGFFVRDGDLTVYNSSIDISAQYMAAITVGVSKEAAGGVDYQPGVIPGRKIILSGNTVVSATATTGNGLYGVYLQGDLTVSNPAKLTAQGTAIAFAVFDGITLDGTAVLSPEGGIVTPSGNGSTVYTIRDANRTAQKSATIGPVALTVDAGDPISYGENTQVTVTADPTLNDTAVYIYKGDEQIGSGKLGEAIPLTTNDWNAGDYTLTARIPEERGLVSEDFTITIGKIAPSVTSSTATDILYGQTLSESALTGEATSPKDGAALAGDWSWVEPDTRPTGSGAFPAQFTPDDGTNYTPSKQFDAEVTVVPAEPVIQIGFPASQRAGKPVEVSAAAANPYDPDFTEGLPPVTLTYTIGDVTEEITGGRFTIPDGTPEGTEITITAATEAVAGKYTASRQTAVMTVADPLPVESITLSAESLVVAEGKKTEPLTIASFQPEDAKIRSISWTSSDPSVAAVDDKGVVTGIKAGTAVITVTADGITATCAVTVNPLADAPVRPPELPEDTEGKQLKVEVETGLSVVPEALTKIPELSTTVQIETALKTKLTDVSVPEENTAVYDVELMVSKDDGATWEIADESNFPKAGLTITLSYPDGTDSSYTFTVVHMFTKDYLDKKAGQTETPEVTNTPDGIRFTVSSLSPISVGWTEPKPSEPPSTSPSDSSSGSGGSGSGERHFMGGGSSGTRTYAVSVNKADHGTVAAGKRNASKGSTVTLTVTPDEGYLLDTLTVAEATGGALKLSGDGPYTFTMPGGAVTVTASFVPIPADGEEPCDGGADCPTHAFADLDADAWYHEAVDYVLSAGIMSGGDGKFGPNEPLSRAQLAQILYNRAGRPALTGASPFTDVSGGAWYANAILWANRTGVVGGYGNGLFGPDDPITREQLAVMLWRYAGSPAASQELPADAAEAGGYALDALRWAVEKGILNGSGGRLNPKGQATRAEAAQMLLRYLDIEQG